MKYIKMYEAFINEANHKFAAGANMKYDVNHDDQIAKQGDTIEFSEFIWGTDNKNNYSGKPIRGVVEFDDVMNYHIKHNNKVYPVRYMQSPKVVKVYKPCKVGDTIEFTTWMGAKAIVHTGVVDTDTKIGMFVIDEEGYTHIVKQIFNIKVV
jgi:uncharacterized protein YkvS